MAHDFKNFPELTNKQAEIYYFESPHKQIFEDFEAEVVKVHDGDTITVKWDKRDFTFPIRLSRIDTPELNEGGEEARDWLKGQILNKIVQVKINPNHRVGKYGRILGEIVSGGINMNEMLLILGYAKRFEQRREGKLPNIEEWF